MTTEQDFHDRLDAEPADWQARLVFADFLQERDDQRAAGYRALGELQLRPLAFKMKSGPQSVVWGFHRGIGMDPNTGKTASWRHALPPAWYRHTQPHHPEDVWLLFGSPLGRKFVEDWAARAFSYLTPQEQAVLLAAGRSRLRCAAAMGV